MKTWTKKVKTWKVLFTEHYEEGCKLLSWSYDKYGATYGPIMPATEKFIQKSMIDTIRDIHDYLMSKSSPSDQGESV